MPKTLIVSGRKDENILYVTYIHTPLPKVPHRNVGKTYIIQFEKLNTVRACCVTNTHLRITALGSSEILQRFLGTAQINVNLVKTGL